MDIILITLSVYLTQMVACAFIHAANYSRIPTGVFDLIKKTFLPYVLYKGMKHFKVR